MYKRQVDEVSLFEKRNPCPNDNAPHVFLCEQHGNMTLPVWVDHVGRAGTRYVTGRLIALENEEPTVDHLPQIDDGSLANPKIGVS